MGWGFIGIIRSWMRGVRRGCELLSLMMDFVEEIHLSIPFLTRKNPSSMQCISFRTKPTAPYA